MNFPDRGAACGLEYLRTLQSLLPDEVRIDVMSNLRDRVTICTWIGNYIDRVNADLQHCLTACHSCFAPEDRRAIEIFAVPLPPSCGLDGLCNIFTTPATILVDVGRVSPIDWLSLVVHEYTHAHLGQPGHDRDFASSLSHLCLGLGLDTPREATEATLRYFPPYQSILDPLAFWRGENNWESLPIVNRCPPAPPPPDLDKMCQSDVTEIR